MTAEFGRWIRSYVAALGIGMGAAAAMLASPAAAQEPVPPAEEQAVPTQTPSSFLLNEELIQHYLDVAVDLSKEMRVLQEQFGVPLLDSDPVGALLEKGAVPEVVAVLGRFGYGIDEWYDFGEAVGQASVYIGSPDIWQQVMGTAFPPFDNVVLVDHYLPQIAAVTDQIYTLLTDAPPQGPAFMQHPRALTEPEVFNFVATHDLLTTPIQTILERYNIVPAADDPTQMNADLAAAGVLADVNAILDQYGYSDLAAWYSVNLATAHAYIWIAYVRSGTADPFGAPPPPLANIAAVEAHFDEITALDIYHITSQ